MPSSDAERVARCSRRMEPMTASPSLGFVIGQAYRTRRRQRRGKRHGKLELQMQESS
jgi:hypothetical protein